MPNFKFVISDKEKSWQVEKDQKACPVLDKKINDKIDGSFLGLEGYELEITGGSDKDGFPMRKDIESITRKKIILTDGIGFNAVHGLRRRKAIRGNTIGLDIVQINCKVVKAGQNPLEELLGKIEKKPKEGEGEEGKEEPKKEEAKTKEEVKTEGKEKAKEEAEAVSSPLPEKVEKGSEPST